MKTERTARVVARYRAGDSLDTIALAEGVRGISVRRWLAAAGEPLRPRGRRPAPDDPQTAARAAELYQAGHTVRAVASTLQVRPTRVSAWLADHGVPARPRGRRPRATR